MSLWARAPEPARRWFRWLVPGSLLALAPKCGLCVLGYLGLGATLGLGGPEFCGAIGTAHVPRAVWVWAAAVAVAVAGFAFRRGRRKG